MRTTVSCILSITVVGALALDPAGIRAQEPIDRPAIVDKPAVVDKFLAAGNGSLVSYEARRVMNVVARGGKMQAMLVARTTLDTEGRFSYAILEETGSGFLRSRVLHPILEAEQEAKRRAQGTHGALTPANYTFTIEDTTPDGLLRVGIKPKRKDDLLVDGSILLTCADGDLVRMEGSLVKRPSFWTRKVRIIRRYGRIGGVRVPITMGSTADVLFAGQSTFTMSYEYASINGAPVAADVTPAVSGVGR
jgi:hypothetical protein